MEFLPLAKSQMKGEGVCVAGLDVETGRWIRPVLNGYRCLFGQEAAEFEWNTLHRVKLGPSQPRPVDDDPDGRHTEDRILNGRPERLRRITPKEKLQILGENKDDHFSRELLAGKCSIFLVQPAAFRCHLDDEGSYRWEFSVLGVWSSELRTQLRSSRIGVGSSGCKCTCPEWTAFAKARLGAAHITERAVESLPGAPTLFLTLTLTALHRDLYWLVVAGVHLVGEDRIWL